MISTFKINEAPINQDQLRLELSSNQAGALCIFEGWVRNINDGKEVSLLEYEANESLCQVEIKNIFKEIKTQNNIINLICTHRVGTLKVTDLAVWVGVSAEHRDDAFKACRYLIDEIKSRLPIWKKEHYLNKSPQWIGV